MLVAFEMPLSVSVGMSRSIWMYTRGAQKRGQGRTTLLSAVAC